MSIRVIIDMNLSPGWKVMLQKHGWEAVHWSEIGNPRASDQEILGWARTNGYIVFTHDLDFGTLLALTHASGPSVLQVRAEDIFPETLEAVIIATLQQHEDDLVSGALLTVDAKRHRIRILPL